MTVIAGRTTRTLALVGGALAVVVWARPLGFPAFGASGAPSAPSSDCEIVSKAAEYGITLGGASTDSGMVETASAAALSQFPGASIARARVSEADSKALPDVDGRSVVVLKIEGAPGLAAAGPAERPSAPLVATCTLAMYDAETGEFLVNLRDFGPA